MTALALQPKLIAELKKILCGEKMEQPDGELWTIGGRPLRNEEGEFQYIKIFEQDIPPLNYDDDADGYVRNTLNCCVSLAQVTPDRELEMDVAYICVAFEGHAEGRQQTAHRDILGLMARIIRRFPAPSELEEFLCLGHDGYYLDNLRRYPLIEGAMWLPFAMKRMDHVWDWGALMNRTPWPGERARGDTGELALRLSEERDSEMEEDSMAAYYTLLDGSEGDT